MKREKPHVQGDPMTAAQMTVRMLRDTMKHPPRFR